MTQKCNTDLGKLILRVSVGGLMLFHGMAKVIHGHEPIKGALATKNLPQILWLGVPLSEVIAPIFLILGIFTRISSALIAFTMIMSIYLAYGMSAFQLTEYGNMQSETNIFYLLTSIAIIFLGSGKYSIYKGDKCILV